MPHNGLTTPYTCKQLAELLLKTPDQVVVVDDQSLVCTAYSGLRVYQATHKDHGLVLMLSVNNPSLKALHNVSNVTAHPSVEKEQKAMRIFREENSRGVSK